MLTIAGGIILALLILWIGFHILVWIWSIIEERGVFHLVKMVFVGLFMTILAIVAALWLLSKAFGPA
jgi:hypothetical protein